MSDHEEHHEEVVESLQEQLEEIFENSDQSIYLYLDDKHKVCNENFASLLGYSSPEEWSEMEGSFPELFVAEASQETLVSAYKDAMERMVGSTNSIIWKTKDGKDVSSTVILVPIAFDGHLVALHFIS